MACRRAGLGDLLGPGQGTNTTLTDATLGHHGEATGPGGPSGLVLNPAFVEALMGFPAGWTELD